MGLLVETNQILSNWRDAYQSLRQIPGVDSDDRMRLSSLKLTNAENYAVKRQFDENQNAVLGIIRNAYADAKPMLDALATQYRPSPLTPGAREVFDGIVFPTPGGNVPSGVNWGWIAVAGLGAVGLAMMLRRKAKA